MKRPPQKPTKPKSSPAKNRTKSVRASSSRASSNTTTLTRKKAPGKPSSRPATTSRTKQSQLITLLGSATGASMAQMTELTGWLPHTVRGMLSGSLRKRLGLNVQYRVEEGVRVYRILGAGEVASA